MVMTTARAEVRRHHHHYGYLVVECPHCPWAQIRRDRPDSRQALTDAHTTHMAQGCPAGQGELDFAPGGCAGHSGRRHRWRVEDQGDPADLLLICLACPRTLVWCQEPAYIRASILRAHPHLVDQLHPAGLPCYEPADYDPWQGL